MAPIDKPFDVAGYKAMLKRLRGDSDVPKNPPVWWIGTPKGTIRVEEGGCYFVDDDGNTIGPADPKLVEEALERSFKK